MKYRNDGFTLIELLVSVGIIGILTFAFIPQILGTREKSIVAASITYSEHCAAKAALAAIEYPGMDLANKACEVDLNAGKMPYFMNSASIGSDGNNVNYTYTIGDSEKAGKITVSIH